jgi:NADH:ubiquinone reductase (H+-translocating)
MKQHTEQDHRHGAGQCSAVLVRSTFQSDFRRINPKSARIVLIDRGTRLLGTFAESLSQAATRRLQNLGIEVRLSQAVDRIDLCA